MPPLEPDNIFDFLKLTNQLWSLQKISENLQHYETFWSGRVRWLEQVLLFS
jgi:hypothetical protein